MSQIENVDNEIDINKFKKSKRIGKGSIGTVYKIEEKTSSNIYSAKIIDCSDDEEKVTKIINQEIIPMMSRNHPTLIKFIGYSKIDFQEENNVTLIMEYAKNGSLANVIDSFQKNNPIAEYSNTTRQIIIAGIAKGMKLLHEKNYMHCNLNPNNILLKEKFHPIITDYYIAKINNIDQSFKKINFNENIKYQAPEIIKDQSYNNKVDVYAFGILIYEIITNSFSYPELDRGEISDLTFRNKVVEENYRPMISSIKNKSIQRLIEKCLSADPNERPTFEKIFNKLAYLNDKDTNNTFNQYLLDNIDVQQYASYIDEITDLNERLFIKIYNIEEENQQLKKDLYLIKSENEQNHIGSLVINEGNKIIEKENDIIKEENEITKEESKVVKEENEIMIEENKFAKEENEIMKEENNFTKEENKDTKENNAKVQNENQIIINEKAEIDLQNVNQSQEYVNCLTERELFNELAKIRSMIKNKDISYINQNPNKVASSWQSVYIEPEIVVNDEPEIDLELLDGLAEQRLIQAAEMREYISPNPDDPVIIMLPDYGSVPKSATKNRKLEIEKEEQDRLNNFVDNIAFANAWRFKKDDADPDIDDDD